MLLKSEGLCQRKSNLEPAVRKIALAMLVQAIRDVRSTDQSKQASEWKEDALQWFAGGEDSAGSFSWVCQILQWDPGKTRAAVDDLRISL